MNKTTDWMTGKSMIPFVDYLKLKRYTDLLASNLEQLVECSGITPEDLFDDSRDTLKEYEKFKNSNQS